jgi:hypothetical protein
MNRAELAIADGLLARAAGNLDRLESFLRGLSQEELANAVAEQVKTLRAQRAELRSQMLPDSQYAGRWP